MLECATWLLFLFLSSPIAVATLLWLRDDRPPSRKPWAGWGASLMMFSFLLLPWLNLQPMKHAGLDIVFEDGGFLVEWIANRWGLGFISRIVTFVSSMDMFLHPRGYVAILFAPYVWLIFMTLFFGFFAYVVAVVVSFRPIPIVNKALIGIAVILLVSLFLSLPDIDGLGEYRLPRRFYPFVVLTGAEIEWFGPLAMFGAFVMMIVGGLNGATARESTIDTFSWED